jgi:hypothetical protein
MGEYGRRRIEERLEWRHEAPRLLAAYRRLEAMPAAADRRAPAVLVPVPRGGQG